MYDLEYLPLALNDMAEIVRYITKELSNPVAAVRLSEEFVKEAEAVRDFPYSMPSYIQIRSLKHEYRKILVNNYIMFYWVDEHKKLITIARVIYGKRDYGKILE